MHGWSRLRGLLVWTVLTASTIGPGTVTMCSKAGADYGAQLLWAVCIAAAVAWIMQEGSGRLTLVSGRSLGDAVRHLTPSGVPRIGRHLFAAFCVVGNFAYECNNFAGTMAAVEIMLLPRPNISAPLGDANGAEASASIHGVDCTAADRATIAEAHRSQSELDDSQRAIRLSVNLALFPVTVLLITGGGAERVSLLLSVVVAWMVVCFAAALSGTGAPPGLLFGLVPHDSCWRRRSRTRCYGDHGHSPQPSSRLFSRANVVARVHAAGCRLGIAALWPHLCPRPADRCICPVAPSVRAF